ncbi:hypothetical protein SCWH03_50270 [Streptomyces pacificus]|uniref:Uncharacterized protein n=1 Tax=Streptomyces pacificus TaxID=2705029 RepID=A0A6A0B259_9ACTN|nr:hypothetical protein SCWH03_50270 [Streptomyces pacificus]
MFEGAWLALGHNAHGEKAIGIEASHTADAPPDWATTLPSFRPCDPAGFTAGYRFTVPLIDMPVYLDCLLRRLRAAGGRSSNGASPRSPTPAPCRRSSTAPASAPMAWFRIPTCGRSVASTSSSPIWA